LEVKENKRNDNICNSEKDEDTHDKKEHLVERKEIFFHYYQIHNNVKIKINQNDPLLDGVHHHQVSEMKKECCHYFGPHRYLLWFVKEEKTIYDDNQKEVYILWDQKTKLKWILHNKT